MPAIEFDESEKSRRSGGYPKLKLQYQERARICVVQKKPTVAFMHRLQAPEIVGGKPVMEMVQASRNSDEMVPKPKMKFISNPGCLGDYAKLKEIGRDPEGCIICAAAKDNDAVEAPQRRFGAHVIKYAVRESSWEAQEPMNVTLQLWIFGPAKFDRLVDIVKDWGPLKDRDLKLGPCINADFQNFEIDIAPNAVWKTTQEYVNHVQNLVENNKCEDIEGEIVRNLKPSQIEEDLNVVIAKSRQASAAMNVAAGMGGAADAAASDETPPDVSADLLNIESAVEASVGNGGGPAEAKPTEEEGTAAFEDFLNL